MKIKKLMKNTPQKTILLSNFKPQTQSDRKIEYNNYTKTPQIFKKKQHER